jgi:hypothetical protein
VELVWRRGWYCFKNETPRRYSKRNHRRSVAAAAKLTAPRLAKVMNTDSIPDVRAVAKKILAKVDPEGKFH